MGRAIVIAFEMVGWSFLGALAIYLPAAGLADRRTRPDHRTHPHAVVHAAGPTTPDVPSVLPHPARTGRRSSPSRPMVAPGAPSVPPTDWQGRIPRRSSALPPTGRTHASHISPDGRPAATAGRWLSHAGLPAPSVPAAPCAAIPRRPHRHAAPSAWHRLVHGGLVLGGAR